MIPPVRSARSIRLSDARKTAAKFKSISRREVAASTRNGAAGSLVIIEAADAADAEAFIKGDPFYAAGIWDRIEIYPFKASMGRWIS